ncbi:uncharacterized protein K444DRAFT_337069 [Hyaloscypha bicolor E]|uniref:Uncharacterized protein n=1 Tax=Hyaloscypha bicolor E TaxID=1095630 RepID=A0A2J6TGP5_9HELO|nr:uncharacterized protein K444DRAFT_337069 [Hyaloscypha bicolor E]PMD62206.1 hypothetical protein K444DRAFT_337069 [Hyaloscypha bicolor E]
MSWGERGREYAPRAALAGVCLHTESRGFGKLGGLKAAPLVDISLDILVASQLRQDALSQLCAVCHPRAPPPSDSRPGRSSSWAWPGLPYPALPCLALSCLASASHAARPPRQASPELLY